MEFMEYILHRYLAASELDYEKRGENALIKVLSEAKHKGNSWLTNMVLLR